MATGFRSDRSTEDAKKRRKQAGMYLKNLRSNTGMTQKELAHKVGLEYYTFVSQIENGTGRVPVELYGKFATAYGVDTQAFARFLVRLYDPAIYSWLFHHSPEQTLEDQYLELISTLP